jgi:hypothetical protein
MFVPPSLIGNDEVLPPRPLGNSDGSLRSQAKILVRANWEMATTAGFFSFRSSEMA